MPGPGFGPVGPDEIAEALPGLEGLHDPERLPPGIEAVRRDASVLHQREIVAHQFERGFDQIGDIVVRLFEGVLQDNHPLDARATPLPSSRTLPILRSSPGPAVNQPGVSNEGAIAVAPVASIRPKVGRRP